MMMQPDMGMAGMGSDCEDYGDCDLDWQPATGSGGGGGTDYAAIFGPISREVGATIRSTQPTFRSVTPYGSVTQYGSGVQTMTGNPLLTGTLGTTTASLGINPSMLLLLGVGLVIVMMAKGKG